ncbi:MAG: 2TM domain-containing protein, partial [Sandaracinaceae bacterium]
MTQRYRDEEAQEILKRAFEQQATSEDGFRKDELVEAARELGLDESAIDRAIEDVERERGTEQVRRDLVRRARERWLRNLVSYLVVMGGLVGLNVLGLVGMWIAWVAFGWGIGVAMSTLRAFRQPTDDEVEREQRKRSARAKQAAFAEKMREARQLEKQLEREEREERRERKRERKRERRDRRGRSRERDERTEKAAEAFESAVEESGALLLSAAAKKIRSANAASSSTPADTDFNPDVAPQKAETAGPP